MITMASSTSQLYAIDQTTVVGVSGHVDQDAGCLE